MNSLMLPRMTTLNNQKAEEIRSNAFYYFLLEVGDAIESDWGNYAQEMIQEFAAKLPISSNWWLERKTAAGMPNRPGKAIEAMKFNWQKFDVMQKVRLADEICNISEAL